jgi:D-glutamate cyclase
MGEDFLDIIGETIDRLLTLDIAGRGVIGKLYEAARALHQSPLCLLAARKLAEAVKPNDIVFIATGMIIYPLQHLGIGENDGPVGGAGLARGLRIALGAKTVFVTDKMLVEMVSKTVNGGENAIVPLKALPEIDLPLSSVIDFPTEEEEAERKSKQLIKDLEPKAIVAIERRGVSKNGVYHAWNGVDMAPYEARIGKLFEECRKQGILTIGIGDGGNEIGMGNIYDTVRKMVPYGDNCKCPAKCGIADSTLVDVAVVATVSNWGAYGIEAGLAALTGKPEALHAEEQALRIIRECIDAGGMDGPAKVPRPFLDAIPEKIDVAILDFLGEIIRGRFREIKY